ncbi:metal-binding protein [Plesiomonas shigelloides]|uniref:metal-binding protein n=1 Tax=Plesiomonas shigelloides TaxID=703 RepID=UPI000D129F2F|nr:metal-binding protein [Plesiomonas shigelloides]AVQ86461.1 metal-binding protein [Plesiomonas shigelloides]
MGKISERIKHLRIKEGYCLICGEFGMLSADHVPPKGSVTITKVEQRHVTEMMGATAKSLKGIESINGSKFKTICRKCNGDVLGVCDMEISRVTRELTNKINRYFSSANCITDTVVVDIDALMYVRGMIGHILSATSVKECLHEPIQTEYFTPLQNFVLGDDRAINDTHDIYYWFYPYNRHLSAKYVHFSNHGHMAGLSLLSFFPLAFLVTPKGQGIYPAQAKQLHITDTQLRLSLSSANISYAEFPFVELKESQMYLLTDYRTIVSYPVK